MTDFASTASRLAERAIELPSSAVGNSVPRDPFEKLSDAAQVHKNTGLAPTVALHIPCDMVDDVGALAKHTEQLGSLTHFGHRIRQKAVDHHFACIDVMNQIGSRDLKIRLAGDVLVRMAS